MLQFGLRIGELLVAKGLITSAQLEAALASQVACGARIGTNLVEQGLLPIDTLGWALGQQHDVPVAELKSLEKVPRATLGAVPRAICSRYHVFPLHYEKLTLHLAMLDPHNLDLIDEVGSILGIRTIHPYVVPELRLHHFLEVHYRISRPKRFLRPPDKVIDQERRHYLHPTVGTDLREEAKPAAPARRRRPASDVIQLVFGREEQPGQQRQRKHPPTPPRQIPPGGGDFEIVVSLDGFAEPQPTHPAGEEIERLERAPDRQTLIDQLLRPLLPEACLAVLFLLRGDLALALGAWGSSLPGPEVRSLVVPLTASPLFARALASRSVVRNVTAEDTVQQMIVSYLRSAPPREVCVVPICPGSQAVNVLCVYARRHFSDAAAARLGRISEAAAAAYRRLMTEEVRAAPEARMPPVGELPAAAGDGPEMDVESDTRLARELNLIPRGRRDFGRYTLVCRLASGGMANLYLAQLKGREGFEKLVAIKRIHEHLGEQEEFIQMFVDEARLAARISHPNVVQVIELDTLEGFHFIAMEYVDGESLATLLTQARPRPALCARIVADAAAGLHAAHELRDKSGELLGVVHRDVSPYNILLGYDGAVKMVDFGVARARGNLHTTSVGALKGRLAYMPPEQIRGDPVDRRADVFSLGVVLYEITAHRRLFKAHSEEATMQNVMRGEIAPPSQVKPDYPPDLERIVMKALEREAEKRHQSAEELQVALEGFLMQSGSLVLSGALGKVMHRVFAENIGRKQEILRRFAAEQREG
jgi:tRNA A-37 threonylcarbamoyl transferase component Bud32